MNSRLVRLAPALLIGSSLAFATATLVLPPDLEYATDREGVAAHERDVPQWRPRGRAERGSDPSRASASPDAARGIALLERAPTDQLGRGISAAGEYDPGTPYHTVTSDEHEESSTGHSPNTDTHMPSSVTHYVNTDEHRVSTTTHKVNTDKHFVNTDDHYVGTDEHFVSTDEHFVNTDEHFVNTDEHFDNTDEHFDNTDEHFVSTNEHFDNTDKHFTNTDEHFDNTDEHFDNTDEHDADTSDHWQNTDTHTSTSTNHFDGSDQHPPGSMTHTGSTTWTPGDSGQPEEEECDNPGQPNRGEALVNGASSLSITTYKISDCGADFRINHKIVTIDTPRTRSLYGQLRLELVSGDPAAIVVQRNGANYTLGTNIGVVETGHSGCGVHTWHSGSESFVVYPMKPGTVVLNAIVDPDPEPEGDGVPTATATISITCPPNSADHELLYKCFIPCEVIDYPFGYAGGDNRSFSPPYTASSRTRQKIIARIRQNTAPIFSEDEGFGLSKEYDSSSITTGTTACPYALIPGAIPTATGTASEPPMQLWTTETMGPPGGLPWVMIRELGFRVSADYPLAVWSCSIDSEFYVDLKECGGHFWYRTHGNHDDFPAHEVYVDGTAVHTFHPGSNSILNLCGFGTDYPVSTWTLVY